MQLHKLQTSFTQAATANDASLLDAINGDAISASERLSVYHHNVVGGLQDVLADVFTATRKLVGDAFFAQMTEAFIAEAPPTESNLNLYGKNFPAFIANYPAARSLPYLSDIAKFEWLWHESYFAADDMPLSAEEIQTIAPEAYPALQFQLRHSVKLFRSDYPAEAIWRYCETEENPPEMDSGSTFLLIMRPDMAVVTLHLTHAEYLFLLSISQGNRLEVAAAQTDINLSECLARYFSVGIFQSFNGRK